MVTKATAKGSTRRQLWGRLALLGLVLALVGGYFLFDLGRYLDLGYLKQAHGSMVQLVNAHPLVSTLVFFVGYVAVTALSLPGAAVMTLAAGAIFGLAWGLVVVSFASSVGATLAMLISRRLLGDIVQRKFAPQLASVNRGLQQDGGFYLFSVRMVPLFPFFVINVVMGLTPIATWTFYWVSQVGMLPGTLVYVFAGTQLATIEQMSDILSPGLIVALSLLGLFPLLARKAVGWLRRARESAKQEG
ncbi:MAG: TVP38/TMEM64 family protein [Pseudomonadales bacterium]